MDTLVTIIVPVFNVEKYIKKCILSLVHQTYSNIEFLIINDCTEDNSINILKDLLDIFPEKKKQFTIINHTVNKGLPSARNTGLKLAKGDFIFHCDSDDWMEPNTIESLIFIAEKENSDIIYSDWFLTFNKNERYMKQSNNSSNLECVKAILEGKMRFNVWNKLVKKSLYYDNNISFPDGLGMGEDMTMIKLFCCAQKISYIPKAYYHYMQINPNAFTKKFSEKSYKDLIKNTLNTIEYIESKFNKENLYEEIHFFKLNVKLPFLISTKKEMYNLWRTTFTESNSSIPHNTGFTFRTKLIQYAAIKQLDLFIKFYNIIIIKFIYGIIYR